MPGFVPCGGVPLHCEDIGPDPAIQNYGCCEGDALYWCDGFVWDMTLRTANCDAVGLECGYQPNYDRMTCGHDGSGGGSPAGACGGTPSTCADIGPNVTTQHYGCCDGNVAYWCDDASGMWTLRSEDCTNLGNVCKYVPTYDGLYCGM